MKKVIIAAMVENGLIMDSTTICEVKFSRKTCNDHTLGAIYLALVFDENSEEYSVCEIFFNCEDLTADFGGNPLFESDDGHEALDFFNKE